MVEYIITLQGSCKHIDEAGYVMVSDGRLMSISQQAAIISQEFNAVTSVQIVLL